MAAASLLQSLGQSTEMGTNNGKPETVAAEWGQADWERLLEAVNLLEAAWKLSPFPNLAAFVPPSDDPLREPVLVELIKVDQEYRWGAGNGTRVEDYLEQWPDLKPNPDRITVLLAAECLTRATLDVLPTSDELQSRFPDIAGLISLEAIHQQARAERSSSADAAKIAQPQNTDTSVSAFDCIQKTVAVGGHIGRFQIRGIVGHGGMGIVFRAYDPQLKREVALKTPLKEPTSDSAVVRRFLREAQIVADIQHPHICPVFDYGEMDGIPYLVMPLVKGDSLGAWLKQKSPEPDQCVELLVKITKAIDRLHVAGILHQDIKPQNVVMSENGEPLLMDFGLAWKSDGDMASVTPDGLVGTPAYMSPEQVRGHTKAIDGRSDIFSLGVLMFEMLTGQPPFTGALFDVLKSIISNNPPMPRDLRPDLDVTLEAICLKAMAKDPADRYQSAKELAAALESRHRPETLSAARLRKSGRRIASRLIVGCAVIALAGLVINSITQRQTNDKARAEGDPDFSLAPPALAPAARREIDKDSVPNGASTSAATVLQLGLGRRTCIEAEITKRRERIWFKVQTKATGLLVVEALTIRDALDPHVAIFDTDLNEVAADGNAGPGRDAQVVLQAEKDHTFYIAVSDAKQDTGPFLLVASQPDTPPPFAPVLGTDFRPPADDNPRGPDSAQEFALDNEGHAVVVESIKPDGDEDWYKFIAKGGGLLLIKVETPHSSLDTHLELYHDQVLLSEDNDRIVVHGLAEDETYLFRIRANSPLRAGHAPVGNYVLRFRYLDGELAGLVFKRN